MYIKNLKMNSQNFRILYLVFEGKPYQLAEKRNKHFEYLLTTKVVILAASLGS